MKKEKEMNLKYIENYDELKLVVNKAAKVVKKHFKKYKLLPSHTLEHISRVTNTALFLAQELNAAIDVVAIAAIFHDVGRPTEQETGISHAEISAQIAESFLSRNNLQEMKFDVTHAIKAHRFSGNIKPETLEAQILQDADALDALGAIGLFRAVSYAVENQKGIEAVIQHCYEKLFLLPDRMHFPISKKMAEQRVKILNQFVEQVTKEIKTDLFFDF